jgi:hypothetical protein
LVLVALADARFVGPPGATDRAEPPMQKLTIEAPMKGAGGCEPPAQDQAHRELPVDSQGIRAPSRLNLALPEEQSGAAR